MYYKRAVALAVSVQSDRERNFWGSTPKAIIVGFRLLHKRGQYVGWVEFNETQQFLEKNQPNLLNSLSSTSSKLLSCFHLRGRERGRVRNVKCAYVKLWHSCLFRFNRSFFFGPAGAPTPDT
ncbi:hypothetical protein D1AOALGA4SA_9254 [Olavius algarvensis Delta 1 endosymbiont]|nr:hypothetical protein D1AOALGA4SA_9254 [Olavius algarvensis Delta 1 endosymbiont]